MKGIILNYKLLICCFLLTNLVLLSSASAGIYYVDKGHSSASDNNSGAETSPWLSIQKAAKVLKAGDTVYVKNGIYNEKVSVANSGTEDAPIVFKAYPGHTPIIDGNGVSASSYIGLFYSSGKNYITLDGFEIRNYSTVLVTIQRGKGLILRNCTIHTSSSAPGLMFDHNSSGLVENNELYDVKDNGMSFESSSNITIQYNYIHDAPNHNGIDLKPKTSEPRAYYSNNKVIGNKITRVTNAIFLRYQLNAEIYNNLMVNICVIQQHLPHMQGGLRFKIR